MKAKSRARRYDNLAGPLWSIKVLDGPIEYMIAKYSILLIFVTLMVTSCSNKNKNSQTTPDFTLEKTIWYALPSQYHTHGDSLKFISDTDVEYYMGELGWGFDSKYILEDDTITIKTITQAYEIEDVSDYNPDLMQKYRISNDSLLLIYLANFMNNKWMEASKERYQMINSFKKINAP